ncbi:hypothetical protein LguiB_028762 [Lonicera macranthoides]
MGRLVHQMWDDSSSRCKSKLYQFFERGKSIHKVFGVMSDEEFGQFSCLIVSLAAGFSSLIVAAAQGMLFREKIWGVHNHHSGGQCGLVVHIIDTSQIDCEQKNHYGVDNCYAHHHEFSRGYDYGLYNLSLIWFTTITDTVPDLTTYH